VAFDKALQYLGLRRAPGTVPTGAERVWTGAMIVAVAVALLVTRDLGFWPQVAVCAAVAAATGVLSAVVSTQVAARRGRRAAD
jgi:hypothetical protein